jgi:hypothetical protein
MSQPEAHTGAADFDFFIGSWSVAHHRLKERLAGCTAWEDFTGSCITQKILGGLGNMDDNIIGLPGGAYRAITLRAFNPATGLWSIWWLDGRNPASLDTPMVGRFQDGIGTFLADDTLAGKPIQVRFLWTMSNAGKPRWEQAFSPDRGQSWETNWVMDFTRADAV